MSYFPECKDRNETFYIDTEKKELMYSINPKNGPEELIRVPFVEVSSEKELIKLRIKEKPILILKNDGKLFYLKVENMKLLLANFKERPIHHCDSCKNCYPGRCKKVRDRFFEALYRNGISNYNNTVKESKRIEKYPFVLDGIELYGLNDKDYFICSKCAFYVHEENGSPVPDFGIV